MSKRRKKRKKLRSISKIKKIVLVLTLAALVLSLLFIPSGYNKISVQQDEDKNFRDADNQIIPSEKIDFPSAEEGTFSGWLKESCSKELIGKEVVLFSSARLPGLVIAYYPEENKLVAGLPPMAAENIFLFDGQKHHLAYTFQKGGWQYLYYDGRQVAASAYQPFLQSEITGLAIGALSPAVSEAFDQIEIS